MKARPNVPNQHFGSPYTPDLARNLYSSHSGQAGEFAAAVYLAKLIYHENQHWVRHLTHLPDSGFLANSSTWLSCLVFRLRSIN